MQIKMAWMSVLQDRVGGLISRDLLRIAGREDHIHTRMMVVARGSAESQQRVKSVYQVTIALQIAVCNGARD